MLGQACQSLIKSRYFRLPGFGALELVALGGQTRCPMKLEDRTTSRGERLKDGTDREHAA